MCDSPLLLHLFLYNIVLIVKVVVRTLPYGTGHQAGIIVLVHGVCHADILFVILIVTEIAAGIAAVLCTHKILLGCKNKTKTDKLR